MSFSDHKITAFTHRITDLPDQPNLPADELKARFDSSPEELRVAHNAVCDDADRLEARVEGIVAETFGDTIDKEMLSDELAAELDAKAVESSVASRITAEQTARESADSSLGSRLSTAESTITTHTSQIAQKCRIYIGTYTGNGAADRYISLGFTPKALLVVRDGCGFGDSHTAALAVEGIQAAITNGAGTFPALKIESGGFRVYYTSGQTPILTNYSGSYYTYLAFRV